MSAQLEFTPEEWVIRPRALRRRVVKCDCGHEGLGDQIGIGVFVCRTRSASFKACGRYCCACVGSCPDEIDLNGTMCSDCWAKKREELGHE